MSSSDVLELPSPRQTTIKQKARRVMVNIPPNSPSASKNYYLNRVQTSKYTIISFLPKNLYQQFHGLANFYFLSLVILQAFPQFKEVDVMVTALPVVIIVAMTAIKDGLEDLKRHSADDGVNSASTYLLEGWVNTNYFSQNNENFYDKISRRIESFVLGLEVFISRFLIGAIEWIRGSPPALEKEAIAKKFPPHISASDYILRSSVIGSNTPVKPEDAWKHRQWKDIKVGDFVLLRNNDNIPADMIIIATGEPESTCYIETKNLDGETNLKVKRGIPELQKVKTPEDCKSIKCYIDAESPNPNLYSFIGTMQLIDPNTSTTNAIPLNHGNLLLRGCVVRNTSWLIGIVVYTGFDTKIMLNSGPTPSKRSRVDRKINSQIFLNTVILISMCLICGILGGLYASTFRFDEAIYIGLTIADIESAITSGILAFFRCLIIYQNIIPIALYISLEVTKTFQSYLIHEDLEMFDEDSKQSCQPKAWNLCDDLGQIEYIFSDKTGTLTSNCMDFKKASINGIVYGLESEFKSSMPQLSSNSGISKYEEDKKLMLSRLQELFDTKYLDKKIGFIDSKIPLHIKANDIQSMKIREFFSLLAVCHTVLVEKSDDSNPNSILYRAQSPDEAALVSAAKNVGFACLNRTDNKVEVDIMGIPRTYTILNILEFNSDRKRMSVVVKRPEGDIILLCKGADSVIYERLDNSVSKDIIDQTSIHLGNFANEGLRTLCLAYRAVSQEEYDTWSVLYRKAQSALVDREKECDTISDLIENNLTLMGATAIEDKLQDGVPESIALLAQAGIKLWVLTGDKMETAINIGFSCNLLKKSMLLIVIQSNSSRETQNQLKEALIRFWDSKGNPLQAGELALVIDGNSLKYALEASCKQLMLELGCRCKAVICCRVSPLQKAMVVRMVREGLGAMCLAIGDGANDVSMIQEADIGIGISGKEGLQAVMASDYAISQFRFLSRLLLVHGRWAYVRSAELVLNYFYKNITWLLILFWHQFFCGSSANLSMEFTYSMFFNTIFTFLPTILVGVFDQDLNHSISVMIPKIYLKGIRQEMYSIERYWVYMAHGVFQSLVCYFGAYLFSYDGMIDFKGIEIDGTSFGTIMACAAIVIINVFSTANWHSWTIITIASFVVSIMTWFLYLILFSLSNESPTYGMIKILLISPKFYAIVVILTLVGLLPKLIYKYIQVIWYPNDTDILLEIQKYKWKPECEFADLGMSERLEKPFNSKDYEFESDSSLKGKSPEITKFTEKVTEKRNTFVPVMDGFGSTPISEISTLGIKKSSSLNPNELENRSRKPSLTGALKSTLSKAIKNFKGDEKKKDDAARVHRAGSLVYMGGKGESVPNNGFAFSHGEGMQNIITPVRSTMEMIEEEITKPAKRRPSQVPNRLRNLSRSIQSVFGGLQRAQTKSNQSIHVTNSENQSITNTEHVLQQESLAFKPLNTIPSVLDTSDQEQKSDESISEGLVLNKTAPNIFILSPNTNINSPQESILPSVQSQDNSGQIQESNSLPDIHIQEPSPENQSPNKN